AEAKVKSPTNIFERLPPLYASTKIKKIKNSHSPHRCKQNQNQKPKNDPPNPQHIPQKPPTKIVEFLPHTAGKLLI
ncbi:MAG: hypothetical protein II983_07655, partial [Firmicutes bacterium]|nr:hypothetical protein [Bacillota bacterium]